METNCEITIGEGDKKKVYDDDTCNWYQKVLLLMVRKEREHLANMEAAKKRPEELIKQLGIVEWFVRQIPVYDSVVFVNHMFGPEIPEAGMIKHDSE